MPDYIGALDQGTSSTRFIVFDRAGAPVVMRQREHRQHLPGPGLVEHDGAELWRNTCQVVTDALEAAGLTGKDLAALGLTNQRETVLAWNRHTGRPYGNALVWQDIRTAERMQHLSSTPAAAVIRHKAGLVPSAYFSASKYAWLLQHDNDLARSVAQGAAMLGTVDSWLMWNLTGGAKGGIHVTDVTNASRTMLMNLETLEWDPELLEVFDIPSALLPRIVPSAHADKLGHTSAEGPFGAEVPITAVLGDQQAALVGQVCFDPGEVKTTYGTGNFILVNTGKEVIRPEGGLLSTVAYQLGDDDPVYALEGAVAYTGSTLQWLRDEIGVLTSTAASEELARQVSDNGGVYLVPAFSGLFSPHWRPDARGVIVGLTRHTTAAHLVRAALESICFQTRDVLQSMERALGRRIEHMKVDGGVTANGLCMQLQADVLGVPLTRPALQETTALGAAYAAGLAAGLWKGTDDLQKIWAASTSWLPTWTEQDRDRAHHQWHKAVNRSLDWVDSDPGDDRLDRDALDQPRARTEPPTNPNMRSHNQMDDTVALNAAHRRDSLRSMTGQKLDILVVGGGIVGAGCALDAATRGLKVGLVEAGDIAAGTSSRSSKLIHGGLRYLEMLQFRLVGEALKERGLLLHDLAPHLVRPVPFLYPLKHRGWERLYAGAGVALYDALARAAGRNRRLPSHRHLSRARALKLAPSMRPDSLVGALQYYDAQVDDARFTMFVARTAATHGAAIATRTRVTSLLREGDRVTGAIVEDRLTGKLHTIHAQHVVLATGVWSGDLLSSGPAPDAVQVRASKGIHLVVPGKTIQSNTGLILRTEHSVLFVIPWGENWIIGTTDTDWTGDRAHPAAQAGDISYLLATINSVLCEPVTTADIIGVYTGLRPLVAGKAEHTAKLSREHVVVQPEPGLTVVAGGKYTTYRVMAQDAIDASVAQLATTAPVPRSSTETTPLAGAQGYRELVDDADLIGKQWALNADQVRALLGRYGSLIAEVLAPASCRPDLLEPVPGAPSHLRAEIVYAVTHEGALHLEDVMTRRTRISIETPDRGLVAAEHVARLMADELDWDMNRTYGEVAHYRARVEAELASQHAVDDEAANSVRTAVPEITAALSQ